MALSGILTRVFAPKAASTSTLSDPSDWLVDALIGSATAAGIRVTPLSAMGVPTVYACVNTISKSLASLPLKLYRRRNDGGKDVADGHPLYSLLHDAPNDEMTSGDFRRAVQANASLRNSGYAYVVRNGMGQVAEVYPISNSDVTVERDERTRELYYLVNGERTPKDKILHIRGLTLNGVSGIDTVSVARESIALSVALQDHGARFFPNAATPSIAIEFPSHMNDAQLKDFAERFDRYNTGNANAHRRLLVHGGAKLVNRNMVNNQQSQFLEARKYQDAAICQVFGVPQIKAGILENNHYATSEQESLNYVVDTLRPWCIQWEQTMNHRLLTERERGRYFFEFGLEGLLRGDHAARAALLKVLFEMGILTRNEIRSLENFNPVQGGDKFFVSQNVKMLDSEGIPVQDTANNTETQSQTASTQ